jgi:hypothetical protein
MKKIVKGLFKIILVVILFTGGSVILTSSGVSTVNEANAATYNQVYEYLVSNGYTVVTLSLKEGTKYDWVAKTSKDLIRYTTTVYCTETSVIGNSDSPM